jgi:hypothetical protein
MVTIEPGTSRRRPCEHGLPPDLHPTSGEGAPGALHLGDAGLTVLAERQWASGLGSIVQSPTASMIARSAYLWSRTTR